MRTQFHSYFGFERSFLNILFRFLYRFQMFIKWSKPKSDNNMHTKTHSPALSFDRWWKCHLQALSCSVAHSYCYSSLPPRGDELHHHHHHQRPVKAITFNLLYLLLLLCGRKRHVFPSSGKQLLSFRFGVCIRFESFRDIVSSQHTSKASAHVLHFFCKTMIAIRRATMKTLPENNEIHL